MSKKFAMDKVIKKAGKDIVNTLLQKGLSLTNINDFGIEGYRLFDNDKASIDIISYAYSYVFRKLVKEKQSLINKSVDK
jgi:hypothetical protein